MFNLFENGGGVVADREGSATSGSGAESSPAPGATGVVRNQNVVYTLPFDAASLGQVLTPVVERVEAQTTAPQVLVVTPDADTALTAARVTVQLAGERALGVLPATGTARAARRLRARPAHVVTGAPDEVLGLIQGSALKLEHVRVMVLAWLDDILATGATPALEAIMNEVPKDAARIVIASRTTDDVEAFLERYLRRARRVGEGVGDHADPVPVRYVAVAGAARGTALRRLLDELDPPHIDIFVRSDESFAEVDALRRTLGYDEGETMRIARGGERVGDAAAEPGSLVVLYDLPGSRQELRALVGTGAAQVVALVNPRQLELLRHLAAGGEVTPFVLTTAPADARSREARMREQLRAVLRAGAPSRELLALEPLLEEFDGIEIAAAALRLLEQERERAARREIAPHAPAPVSSEWTSLFVNIGERDGARVGDLVGAITGEAGLTREQIGRVELRESHAVVQVATPVAQRVVERLTGTMIRGRRVAARVDRDGGGGGRGARSGGRGGPRGAGDRGERGGRSDRGERGGRPGRARGERNAGRAASERTTEGREAPGRRRPGNWERNGE